MTQYEAATLVGLVTGPIFAVLITLWWQDRAEKRNAKRTLFVTLMAYRRSSPPTLDWANALNLIDVIFADSAIVVHLWHELYDILNTPPPTQVNWQAWNHKYLNLLSEMARILGYRALQQTDIDKFYSPQAHGNVQQLNTAILQELLRVLKATESLPIVPRAIDVEPVQQ